MSPAPSPAERIDLLSADDPRDVVHRAVACLAQGGVVRLPMGTSYGLAASALNPQAVARVRQLKGLDDSRPLSLGLREPDEVADWVPSASPLGRKLARRAWPGPVTLVFRGDVEQGLAAHLPPEVQRSVAPGGAIGLRLPGHEIVREILDLLPGPVVLTSVPREGPDSAATAELATRGHGLDLVLDEGPDGAGGRNTIVAIDRDGWKLVREGAVSEEAIRRLTGTILLFVCTGNTCRSPMAEALCRALIAERLGCSPEDVESRGYAVGSAGLAAGRGMRAASDAMAIVQARGASLKSHASRQISPTLVSQADFILTMTRDHLEALLDAFPEAGHRVRLLDPDGGDIADPIGTDRETYRRTAETIEAHLHRLLREMGVGDR